jgi:hypothetical protein
LAAANPEELGFHLLRILRCFRGHETFPSRLLSKHTSAAEAALIRRGSFVGVETPTYLSRPIAQSDCERTNVYLSDASASGEVLGSEGI